MSVLYSSIRSPHCLKVGMVLSEKGVPFRRIEIDLPARQQKTPAFRAKNPLGLVPVYEDDRGIHADSLVMLRYLNVRYPLFRLFLPEADRLAHVPAWIDLFSEPMRDVSHHLYWQLIEPPKTGIDQEKVAALKVQGMDLLARMDAQLAGASYLCGELSAADFAVFAWVYGYQRFQLPPDGHVPYPYDLDRAKALLAEAGYADGITFAMDAPVGRYAQDKEVAEALVGQWAKASINVTLNLNEWSVQLTKYRADELTDSHFIDWGTSTFGADDILFNAFAQQPNKSHYTNDRVAYLLTRAHTSMNPEERKELNSQALRVIYEDVPWLFLFQQNDIYGVRSTIEWQPRPDQKIEVRTMTLG